MIAAATESAARLAIRLLVLTLLGGSLLGDRLAAQASAAAQLPERPGAQLQVGHWLRVKGAFDDAGRFVASAIELRDPAGEESLVGTAGPAGGAGDFTLLGQPVMTSDRTRWDGMARDAVVGARVEVEGHWRGPRKFSARRVTGRGPGRDRLEGRVDALSRDGDAGLRLAIMGLDVRVPGDLPVEHARPVSDYALAPAVIRTAARGGEDDDEIAGSLALGAGLRFGGQLEWKQQRRDDQDLDDQRRDARREDGASARLQLEWEPTDDFGARLALRGAASVDREQDEPRSRENDLELAEAWGRWHDALGPGVDVQVGRQDFDDPREWIYDQNLDALRVHWRGEGLALELSASTVLADGSPADQDARNLIAYLSNGDDERHLALWVVDRRADSDPLGRPIHAGLRLLGQWLPDHELWADWSLRRGYTDTEDLRGWAVDLGTTWSPPALDPVYVVMGLARASGDDDPLDGVDHAYRQTGLQDNNGRFGGVTSFRYYGETLDPELSNLTVLTAGLGRRVGEDSSVDLVWHGYSQVERAASLTNASLKDRPMGLHRDLGAGLDLILGTRHWRPWDVELTLGVFEPGRAFLDDDRAWRAQLQMRYRF